MAPRSDTERRAVVTLFLDRGTETVSGTVADGSREGVPFWGWVELSTVLERLRAASIAAPTDQQHQCLDTAFFADYAPRTRCWFQRL